ncbi:MAG: chemotaxis protein CheX [Desulfobulbaceae bacterium]|nr:chemotaxis protein CheX [Desulfobulbaceae bacterium]
MNQEKRINKIIEAVETRIQDEVGGLLGVDFTLISGERQSISKGSAFESLQGKQICAQMDITGEITGKGCLLIGIKDAIRLGGTLIMLPAAELNEVIGREEYSEEIEDSYGEIANIIAGSFTKDFEEMYPKSCRFVRKEQEVIVPAKVDIDSDGPIENQNYYQVSASMALDGRQMGELVMLMPAATFDLQEPEKVEEPSPASAESGDLDKENSQQGGAEPRSKTEETTAKGQVLDSPKKQNGGSTFDTEKHKKKVDLILAECQKKMETEVGALLGVDITLGDIENRFLSKEDFFLDHVSGRQVVADMDVTGEVVGKSYLTVSVKDAIHLGGILIMLPPSELENVVKEEDFSEDSRDAYGEIANIISGVYTAVFEEQYSQKLRFIRKELQDIVPAKVDVASDEPIPDKTYYTSSLSMAVEGKPLGKLQMLFPADLLKLDSPKEEVESGAASETGQQTPSTSDRSSPAKEQITELTTACKPEQGVSANVSQLDTKKHQKRVDKVLATCRDRMVGEVSAILGTDVKFTNLENLLVSKEEFFFDEVSGKQVIANMDVVGELEGKSYLSVGLRDAIRIGGALIMLPTAELESVIADEEFGEDTEDAYGEIANIIAGVYTAVFEEQYIKQLRFIKTDLQQIAPMKVDIGADEPIADEDYYLSRMDLTLGDLELGKINILFPASLLQLSGLRPGSIVEEESVSSIELDPAGHESIGHESIGLERGQDGADNGLQTPDILVVGDDEQEAAKITDVLGQLGYLVKNLSFKDNLHNYIPGNLRAVYLVMQDVNEQAFGVAIKVSSACSVPLIAAGPGWTRTKVIKAVKYGVRDILLTPASQEDIEENVNNNLLELAA